MVCSRSDLPRMCFFPSVAFVEQLGRNQSSVTGLHCFRISNLAVDQGIDDGNDEAPNLCIEISFDHVVKRI